MSTQSHLLPHSLLRVTQLAAAPDGLYWYMVPGKDPEPVLIDRARYADRFKAFNCREQSWLREGEYLLGPVAPPADDGSLPRRAAESELDRARSDAEQVLAAVTLLRDSIKRKVDGGSAAVTLDDLAQADAAVARAEAVLAELSPTP